MLRSGMEARPYNDMPFVGCGFHAAPLPLHLPHQNGIMAVSQNQARWSSG